MHIPSYFRQTVSISILCVVLWHRQRTLNYHRRQRRLRLDGDEVDTRAEYRPANGLGHGCLVIFLSVIFSIVVGICASHKFLGANSTSPIADLFRPSRRNVTESVADVTEAAQRPLSCRCQCYKLVQKPFYAKNGILCICRKNKAL